MADFIMYLPPFTNFRFQSSLFLVPALVHHKWNNQLRHDERRREFDVAQLKSLAATSVGRSANDVERFEKLAEGGFNRTFLLKMQDGFQMVARIPYSATEPRNLLVASEVATMDFLRSQDIPIPKVYDYSISSHNSARTEYIFMELAQGTNLGDIWFDLGEKARIRVVKKLVELESRLFSITFPANGSLYYARDLDEIYNKVPLPAHSKSDERQICIGPDMTLSLWYGKRRTLDTFRGPYRNPAEVFTAGAQKELWFLAKYGRPLHPFQRLHRELFNYQRQLPSEYANLLNKYLQVVPFLETQVNETARQPRIRHPDLQPNNIFVSDDLSITGVIDWQHCAILPAFILGGIPSSLQNHGDAVSESLEPPKLSENFDNLDDYEQFKEVELFRKRQLHYHYVATTMECASIHTEVLLDPVYILLRKLYTNSTDPWEGDNVTLKAILIELTRKWASMTRPSHSSSTLRCPIEFSDREVTECLHRASAMQGANRQLQTCLDLVGVGPEGWVPTERYDEAKRREQKLLHDTLDDAESDDDRAQMEANWIFAEFDETEYI